MVLGTTPVNNVEKFEFIKAMLFNDVVTPSQELLLTLATNTSLVRFRRYSRHAPVGQNFSPAAADFAVRAGGVLSLALPTDPRTTDQFCVGCVDGQIRVIKNQAGAGWISVEVEEDLSSTAYAPRFV